MLDRRQKFVPEGTFVGVMFWLVFSLGLIALVLWASQANAASYRLELGLGQSHFALHGDGTWYQSDWPYSNDLRGNVVQLGLSKHFDAFDGEPYAMGWRVAYVDLGDTSNSAQWVTDAAFAAHATHCNPCWHGTSHWHVAGVSAGGTLDWNALPGRATVGVEAGWYLYRSGGQVDYTQTVGCSADCSNSYVVPDSWHSTPYVGIEARYGYAFAALREYKRIDTQTGGQIGLLGGGSTKQVTIGVSYPF